MTLVVLQKPAYGAPCNRCGVCCERSLCKTAMEKYRPGLDPFDEAVNRGPCPSLIRHADGTTSCGLWEKVKTWIAMGGCFAPDL